MSYLAQEAARLADIESERINSCYLTQALEANLQRPFAHDHMLNVTYLMHVLARAQEILIQSKFAIQDAHMPMDTFAFDKAFWALEGVYVTLTPIVLANANAVLATQKAVQG